MATERRVGKNPPEHFRREESPLRYDTGVYIGKIKNNIDPTRSGRLQVYIPDLSSNNENDPVNWRTVAYASPFIGMTTQPDNNKQNAFKKVKHTYGLWAVPPDIGNLVLCVFVMGDPNRGFWFACIPGQLGHHMLPGIAGSYNVDPAQIDDPVVKENYKNEPTVVAEFNENDPDANWTNFANLKKPIHEEQYKVYLEQGLQEDYVRGIVSSSSQRESPSFVFGMSTPGRPTLESLSNAATIEKAVAGEYNEQDYAVASRKGGHSFVMDDGNFQDKDRLVRLRTSSGHQIMMNDSEKILYIANSDGSVWIEMTAPGHLNIYAGNSVNIRAQGELNFHADKNINLNAGADIKISAGKSLQIQSQSMTLNAVSDLTMFGSAKTNLGSGGSLNLNSSGDTNVLGSAGVNITGSRVKLNDGYSGASIFSKPAPLKFNKLSDVGKQGRKWVNVDGALSTIVTVAPTHEPWILHSPTALSGATAANVSQVRAGGPDSGYIGSENGVTSGDPPSKDVPVVDCKSQGTPTDPGPVAAQRVGVKNPVNRSYLNRSDNPTVSEGIGPLSADQVRAYNTQIAWNESSWNYNADNRRGFLGKYQIGAAGLADLKYIKLDAYRLYGDRAVYYPTSWTGKDGINSKEDFLSNNGLQEKIMHEYTKLNYRYLTSNGAIKSGDDICTVAGMLGVAHLIGQGAAKNWRRSAAGQDGNGTTGTTYFNMGRYAVDVLAAPPTQVAQTNTAKTS